MKVRQSSLKQFGICGRQYYYAQILQLGGEEVGSLTILGSVFHYAVDVYENYGYNVKQAHKTFDWYWDHPELLGLRIDFYHTRTTKEGLRKRAHAMLDRYHELRPWSDGTLIGTEVNFTVPIGDHELTGTIDKLWYRPGQKKVEVIDFKTGSFVPKKLRYNIQFTAYCYATTRPEFWEQVKNTEFSDGYERFINYKRAGWWYHARNNKMFNAGGRGERDYKRLSLAVVEMDNAINANVFPLDYQGENCGWCAYADEICGSEMDDPSFVNLPKLPVKEER
jgi:hypothetical protein